MTNDETFLDISDAVPFTIYAQNATVSGSGSYLL